MSPNRARSRGPAIVDLSTLSSSARFRWIEHRRLSGRHHVLGPAHSILQRRSSRLRRTETVDTRGSQPARDNCVAAGLVSHAAEFTVGLTPLLPHR